MALREVADGYFSNLNSIAVRLYDDFKETKSVHENRWSVFSENEKQKILNDSIIKPEIQLKYNLHSNEISSRKPNPKLIIEDNCSYHDEHSAPFSFKTKSQENLTIFESVVETPKTKELPTKEYVYFKVRLINKV